MTQEDLESIIGMKSDEAEQLLKDNNVEYRYKSIDGQGCIGTCDYHIERVNLVVKNGLIESYSFG